MKHSTKIIVFVSIMILVMTGCKKIIKHEQHGWVIRVC